MPESEHILKLKVALVGEEGVGKTSLVHRFVSGAFDPSYIRTLGVVVSKKTFEMDDADKGPVTVHVMIHDLMGKETFLHLFQDAYFRGVQGIVAIFDVTRPASLQTLPRWLDAAREVAGPVPMVVLGNKTDLVERRETSEEEADEAPQSCTRRRNPVRTWRTPSADSLGPSSGRRRVRNQVEPFRESSSGFGSTAHSGCAAPGKSPPKAGGAARIERILLPPGVAQIRLHLSPAAVPKNVVEMRSSRRNR